MSYFGQGGGEGDSFHGRLGRKWEGTEPAVAPPERAGSGPRFRIDPGSADSSALESLVNSVGTGSATPEATPGLAEIRGTCNIATIEWIRLLLAEFPDEHASLEYRVQSAVTGSDTDLSFKHSGLVAWTPITPP